MLFKFKDFYRRNIQKTQITHVQYKNFFQKATDFIFFLEKSYISIIQNNLTVAAKCQKK